MRRFRPNIVLGGVEPGDEDRIRGWRVHTPEGVAALENVKPCARCPIPNVDPDTAASSPAVGDALQAYRQDPRLNGAITFGMNAIILEGLERTLRGRPYLTARELFMMARRVFFHVGLPKTGTTYKGEYSLDGRGHFRFPDEADGFDGHDGEQLDLKLVQAG